MSAVPPVPPPRQARAGRGCLWGCLALVAIIFAPIIGTLGYGAWYLHDGFRRDPALGQAIDMLRGDGLSRQVLGDHIEITGIEGNAFSAATGWGSGSLHQRAYVAALRGSKGEGHLELLVDVRAHGFVTRAMLLTGPDGRRYDLLAHVPITPPGPTDSI